MKVFHKHRIYQFISFASLSLIVLLSGCSTLKIGRDFDMQVFESMVKVGETTKSQVMTKIGSPKSTGVAMNMEGERMQEWVYFYASGQLPGMKDTRLKLLQMRFDQNGILRSYNWSNSE
ncbi:MAG: hypothetical protein OEY29_04020 [Gammaproteobacteria bacterium]|nr:hypothetical protein [Gammaproteobacteria bacterium]